MNAYIILNSGNDTDTIAFLAWKTSESKTHYSKVDLSPWENLIDSGSYDYNNLKRGLWIEYPIDTSIMNSKYNIRNDSLNSKIYKPTLSKMIGNYFHGKKNGRWEIYGKAFDSWELEKTIEYKDGVKNGVEITYSPWSTDTIMKTIYENNNPIEFRQYDPPNKIKFVLRTKGEKCLKYDYDSNGKIIKITEVE
ncbi:hypothetical protein ACE01N_20190 [Saccharicrinis sp. FJH2]|uniref:hypothetical protein n=1 Tax=Saccharicrinis sp. FJH65 TaxID=3344659 RepID=UPI0035F2EB15